MADLASAVLERLGLPASTLAPSGQDLEAWLAHLASDEPWLMDSDNLRNHACFLEGVRAIYDSIVEAESKSTDHFPSWLDRLAWQWSHEGATILTFNYDTLLEIALVQTRWTHNLVHYYSVPLVERQLPGTGGIFAETPPTRALPTLLKLHGSINWMHAGDKAPSTEQLVYRPRFQKAENDSARYTDLEPFLVPPTSAKNTYYGKTALTAQWREAATALRAADELDVIGYSFPASDLATRTFLATNLSATANVTVVDPGESALQSASRALPEHTLDSHMHSVEAYADLRAGTRISAWYDRLNPDLPLNWEIDGVVSSEPLNDSYSSDIVERIVRQRYGSARYIVGGGRSLNEDRIRTIEAFAPYPGT